jgi:hypothetical protein
MADGTSTSPPSRKHGVIHKKVGPVNLWLNHRADLLNDYWPILLGEKLVFVILN